MHILVQGGVSVICTVYYTVGKATVLLATGIRKRRDNAGASSHARELSQGVSKSGCPSILQRVSYFVNFVKRSLTVCFLTGLSFRLPSGPKSSLKIVPI